MKKFINFIREQGVVGLAVGFILGGAAKDVVNSLVEDIVNPIIGMFLGATHGLESATVTIAGAQIRYGAFISVLIDFIIVAAVVFYVVKGFGFEKLDRKNK